jgi:hypothetical protein
MFLINISKSLLSNKASHLILFKAETAFSADALDTGMDK